MKEKLAITNHVAPTTYSIDQIFSIYAIPQGNIAIHFFQIRPWEKDKHPLNKLDIDIIIKDG